MYEVEIFNETGREADIDIYMSTYQHAPYVAQAIESILMQKTHYKYRIVIGDDCSTDGTQEIIKEYQKNYPDRIVVALSKTNTKTQFWNQLWFEFSSCDYVANLEGDDYWIDPYKLEKQITFLNNHPEYIGVTGNVRNVNADGSKQHCDFSLYSFRESHVFGRENVMQMELVSHISALLYRNFKKTWRKEDHDRYIMCRMNGDMKTSSLLGMMGNVYYSHEVYGDHRRVFTGTSWTAQTRGKNTAELMITMWEDLYTYIYELFNISLPIASEIALLREQKEAIPPDPNHVDDLMKKKNTIWMYDMWMLSKEGGDSVAKVLERLGMHRILIYGLAELGIRLFYELKETAITVVGGIDKNRAINLAFLDVFHEIPPKKQDVEAVVVTALTSYDEIRGELEKAGYERIIALDEILYHMIPIDPIFDGYEVTN